MQIVVTEDGRPQLLRAAHFNEFVVLLRAGQAQLPEILVRDGESHVWVQEAWLRSEMERAAPIPESPHRGLHADEIVSLNPRAFITLNKVSELGARCPDRLL